jgi:hypothetical protein
MPFDPTLRVKNLLVSSSELRNQAVNLWRSETKVGRHLRAPMRLYGGLQGKGPLGARSVPPEITAVIESQPGGSVPIARGREGRWE